MTDSLNQVNLLIVEDDAIIAEDIKDICQNAGYQVVKTAFNAGQALLALKAFEIDLILLDIHLDDDLNGIDVALYVKENYPSIPYIFLTSYSDKLTLNQARKVFPSGYITKPFNKEQLLSTIDISLYNHFHTHHGRSINKEKLNSKLIQPITEREWEIMGHILDGKPNQHIAILENTSINTVKFHIKNIYDKLDVHTRAGLILKLGK
ncbi:MAG: DNA-binding response regulator [Saprospiraceae bacterium]|nr:DNA-binding response regulator [Saprospiraceae bacterium]